VEVLVGDSRLVENKRWKFAQVLAKFSMPAKTGPLTETDYVLQPIIQHQFQPPMPETPFLVLQLRKQKEEQAKTTATTI
jgi:hypothetical protein